MFGGRGGGKLRQVRRTLVPGERDWQSEATSGTGCVAVGFQCQGQGSGFTRKPQRFCEVHNGRNTACAQDGSCGETSEARRKVGLLLIDIGA